VFLSTFGIVRNQHKSLERGWCGTHLYWHRSPRFWQVQAERGTMVGTMKVIWFEVNVNIIDEKERFGGIGNNGEDFIYDGQEWCVAKWEPSGSPLDRMWMEEKWLATLTSNERLHSSFVTGMGGGLGGRTHGGYRGWDVAKL